MTFDEHFDTFVPASKQPGHMQTLLEKLYSQQTTFGETDFSALCVHLNKHVNKRSFLVLYTNFASISSMNRQLALLAAAQPSTSFAGGFSLRMLT